MRLFRLLVVVLLTGIIIPAAAVQIVTPDEALASLNSLPLSEATVSPLDPLAPQIWLVDPDPNGIDQVVRNPFKMEVVFKTQDGATLDFRSFQALYGALKVDITERLLKEAIKTPNGLRIVNVNVPSGKHRILLRIKDSMNRLAEKEIQFRVD